MLAPICRNASHPLSAAHPRMPTMLEPLPTPVSLRVAPCQDGLLRSMRWKPQNSTGWMLRPETTIRLIIGFHSVYLRTRRRLVRPDHSCMGSGLILSWYLERLGSRTRNCKGGKGLPLAASVIEMMKHWGCSGSGILTRIKKFQFGSRWAWQTVKNSIAASQLSE